MSQPTPERGESCENQTMELCWAMRHDSNCRYYNKLDVPLTKQLIFSFMHAQGRVS